MKSLSILNRLNLISLRKGLQANSRLLSQHYKEQYRPLIDKSIIETIRTSQNEDNNK